jgi:3-hydroxyisobutyrate dehydrogenase-like beta-hydroxyacid dehydrogenase
MAEVAVLGTGRMGAALARRFAAAGHRVTVWNRTAAGAHALAGDAPPGRIIVAASAAEAVRARDVVVAMLADGAATCEVLLDATVIDALAPGTVVCDMATSGREAALRLSGELGAAGTRFLDAPVSGSVPAVDAGTLLVMAAGEPDALEAARPVLAAVADRVVHVGPAGAGQAMKLAVNLVVHDLNAALAESLALAERSGITRSAAYDVLSQSVVAAPYVLYKKQAFLDPETPVAMSLELVAKDLRLIGAAARSAGASHRVTDAVRALVDDACAAGLAQSDMAALSRFSG